MGKELIDKYKSARKKLKDAEKRLKHSDQVECQELLMQLEDDVKDIELDLLDWSIDLSFRMQLIIKYKIFDGMTWQQVAVKLGRSATADSVRKEYSRFLKEEKRS